MQKRTQLTLVILAALILLAIGIYFLLSPFLANQPAQPPALPSVTTPALPSVPPKPTTGGTATSTAAAVPVDRNLHVLENRAGADVGRIGSGSSDTGFLGYHDVLLDFTANGQSALLADQAKLQQDHPAKGPAYGLATTPASSHITGAQYGDATITATVQAVQEQYVGNAVKPTVVYKKAVVTFAKQDNGTYLIDSVVWSDLAL